MSTYKDPDSCRYGGVKRRDFRASKDGPEEMPHKKRGYGSMNRSKCEHNWSEWNIVRSYYNWNDVDENHIRRWNSQSKTRHCKVCHRRDYEYKSWSEIIRKPGSLPEWTNGPSC